MTETLGSNDPPTGSHVLPDGKRAESWQNDRGELHRVGGPAILVTNGDGSPVSEAWYLDGKMHRIGGPAQRSFHEGGSVHQETWKVAERRHRVDGPALLAYWPDGSVAGQEWYFENDLVGYGHEDASAKIAEKISKRPKKRTIASYFEGSPLHELFADGREDPEKLLGIFAEGVCTPDGMREVLDGAPPEWVRSWESGR